MPSSKLEAAEKTREVGPFNSCLPSCFGISGSREGMREKSRFSLWRSRMRKSGVKTVPMDISGSQKQTGGASRDAEVNNKADAKLQICGDKGPASVAAVTDAAAVGKSKKPKFGNGQLTPPVEVNFPECASPRLASPPTYTAPSSPLFQPTRRKQRHPTGASRLSGQRQDGKTGKFDGRLDPAVGLSVIMVVLAIMLLWGRTCAILCTSAWFYFIPRLRTAGHSGKVAENQMEAGNLDLDSEEYKKKVILEGLLERNRRHPVVIL